MLPFQLRYKIDEGRSTSSSRKVCEPRVAAIDVHSWVNWCANKYWPTLWHGLQ